MTHLRYLWYLLRHKWYVALEGWNLGVGVWRLIRHDWSKFTPAEWNAYAQHFYAKTPPDRRRDDPAFEAAWLHHVHCNDHHWEHWVLPKAGGDVAVLRMPERCVREMAADWRGVSRTLDQEPLAWYAKNRERLHLHPATRSRVEVLLGFTLPRPELVVVAELRRREIL